jgi:ribosome-associated toxin RatA of RatAB toxin-antitoxin module
MNGGKMSTTGPRFTARIEVSPEIIFDLIADMPKYGRGLPGSEASDVNHRFRSRFCKVTDQEARSGTAKWMYQGK